MSGGLIRWKAMKFMTRPSKYPRELRERAVRMVLETRDDYPSEFEAIRSVATKVGIGSSETLRKWVRRAKADAGDRVGTPTDVSAQLTMPT